MPLGSFLARPGGAGFIMSGPGVQTYPALAGRISGWAPASLGAARLAWWDANRADLITEVAGAVSSWKDEVAAYDMVQATGAKQPIYSTTSFGGSPGITADGTDDELTQATPAWAPTGANPSEMWHLISQDTPGATTSPNTRSVFGWGATAGTNERTTVRISASSVNRARIVGPGFSYTNSVVDFSGRCVVRSIFTGTVASVEVNGVVGAAPTAHVPATSGTRARIFANPFATATAFYLGTAAIIGVTSLLTPAEANQLFLYMMSRRNP